MVNFEDFRGKKGNVNVQDYGTKKLNCFEGGAQESFSIPFLGFKFYHFDFFISFDVKCDCFILFLCHFRCQLGKTTKIRGGDIVKRNEKIAGFYAR